MKKLIALGVLILTLTACGNDDSSYTCADTNLEGTWYNSLSTDQELVFSNSCTFTQNYCDHVGSFTLPSQDTGDTVLNLSQANLNGGCMQTSGNPFSCTFKIEGQKLYIDCGTTLQYTYQRNFL